MRVVVALGGNALLRRGQPLTAENQRENARAACRALAPVALEHELVISHGNGPQVGLLALQGSAYTAVDTYPLDVLGAQTEGMIGYLHRAGARQRAARSTAPGDAADDDRGRPATTPRSAIRRSRSARFTTRTRRRARRPRRAGRSSPTATSFGGWCRRRCPSASSRSSRSSALLEQGCVVICAGGGGIPTMYTTTPAPAGRRLVGVEAVIDKDLASALLATDLDADVLAIVTDVDAVYTDWGTPGQRRDPARHAGDARRRRSSPPARWARRCAPRARSSSARAGSP